MLGKMEIRTPPGSRPRDGRHCDLCGCSQPAVRCDKCGCQIFCLSCDDMYHRHPKRRFHLRKAVDPTPPVPQARPVLPVKVAHLNAASPGDPSKMPLPPPRKKKSLFGSFRKPSPSSDSSPPLPKKEYSWTDRLGSIKKFMSNRPLPPLPTSDDNDVEPQPTTNGQTTRGDLSFIHKKSDERPPQLPQRSPRSPDFSGNNVERDNRSPASLGHMPGQMRNGSVDHNINHMNQNRDSPQNEEMQWNNMMNNQNGPQRFGTLNRQGHQRGFVPPAGPGYPGGMHQSSSATDLHSLHNAEGMPGAGQVPPHFPHYPMNPHMPPHYPYPMYPQYPNYPQYFGNSFANLSNPPTSEGDFSDHSETTPRHSSKKQPFRKRAKRSQSVMMDRMGYPGQFYPFGPYPGYGPWGAPMPMEAPPSPASSIRSLNRAGRTRRRKKTTSEDDDDEFSVSSSPLSRPKSSSSDPKETGRAPLATQTTSSEEESDDEMRNRRNKLNTIQRRQSEPLRKASPVIESKRIARLKKSSSKQSDSDAQESPDVQTERRASVDSNTEQPTQQQISATTPGQSHVWECKHCTFVNSASNKICQVCCKTFSPRTQTPSAVQSRPTSAAANSSRKQSVDSERGCSSPEKFHDVEEDTGKKERQDMASLNSALDEAEKQISKGLEELMKLKDDIDANISKEKSKASESPPQPENTETPKPVYKSSGRMRTSILDKLNLNKPQTSNASVSTSTESQGRQGNWTSDKIIEARRHSNSSSDAYNSPLAQSPELERAYLSNQKKRDSSCQTQQDNLVEYLEKKKAAEEAFLGRPVNNFGFGYGDRMDMMTSPVPSMYDRFLGGGYGGMQRSHSRASLFTGRMNDFGPVDYGGGFGYGPTPMYRSSSRSSLTGDYPDGRMSEFHNLRKPDFYLSMEELVERRRQENIRAQGLELVRMIREAEQQGFNADDIQVALTHCGKQNPMEWLQENWRNMVDSVITLSTNYGNDKKENDIGLLSENEARDALRLHKGNIWAAVTECVEGRQRKYLELSARGNFSRKYIVDALTSSDGDVEMAYAKLSKSTGKPFLMRIWGAGEGAQNQDGARPLPEDIHDLPQRYLKDDPMNSDELSEEIWSEDGDWDDDQDYGEERGDIEDLQTCHEDLYTEPQEMRTPESDRSDYCDPFPVDDRNASSPSDDIFFVIPEAKPEKKKGFLSKLAALRKNSREQADTASIISKDELASEPSFQTKEDTISQNSASSSELTRNSGALSALKNTLSAIKDTVTGGTKSDKKLPCAQPEKRTIIVRGQIDHESLNADSTDGVKLTSIKLLESDSQLMPIKETTETNKQMVVSEIESTGTDKQSNIAVNKETIESDYTEKKLSKREQKDNDQPQVSAESIPKPSESKNKVETKKPQSLAERLKFAKQSRSAASASTGFPTIQKESSVPEVEVKCTIDSKTNKDELYLNHGNKTFKQPEPKNISNINDNTIKQIQKEFPLSAEKDKLENVVSDLAQSNKSSVQQNINKETKAQSDKVPSIPVNSVEKSTVASPADSSDSLMSKKEPSESKRPQAKMADISKVKPMSEVKSAGTSLEITDKIEAADKAFEKTTKADSIHLEKTVDAKLSVSSTNTIAELDENNTIQHLETLKTEVPGKSDIPVSSNSLVENLSSETETKSDLSRPKNLMVEEGKLKATASESENASTLFGTKDTNVNKNDIVEVDDKIDSRTGETFDVLSKGNVEETKNEKHIPTPTTTYAVSPDTNRGVLETSVNNATGSNSGNAVNSSIKENNRSTENITLMNGNVTITQNSKEISDHSKLESIEGASSSNKDAVTNSSLKNLKEESENRCKHDIATKIEVAVENIKTSESVQGDKLEQVPDSKSQRNLSCVQTDIYQSASTSYRDEKEAKLPIASRIGNASEDTVPESSQEYLLFQQESNIAASRQEIVPDKSLDSQQSDHQEFNVTDPVQKIEPENSSVEQTPIQTSEQNNSPNTVPETSINNNKSDSQENYVQSMEVKPLEEVPKVLQKTEFGSNNSQKEATNINQAEEASAISSENISPSTSSNENTKVGKFKFSKSGKVKKTQVKSDKKETQDKDKVQTTPGASSFFNKSSNVEADSESKASTSHNDVSTVTEVSSQEITSSELIKTEILGEKEPNDSEAEKSLNSGNEMPGAESKTIPNEKHLISTEQNKLQSSSNENKSPEQESASGTSSEPLQNNSIPKESQNSTPTENVNTASISSGDIKTDDVKVQKASETEQKATEPTATPNAANNNENILPQEVELQEPVVSKEFPGIKNSSINDTPSSSSINVSDSSNILASSSSTVETTVAKEKGKVAESSSSPEQNIQHSKTHDVSVSDTSASGSNTISSPASSVFPSKNTSENRTVNEDRNTSQTVDSDISDNEYSDESRPSSVTPPSPVDALRSRFEGLSGGTSVRGQTRPQSPFRRMSLNSRKQVIALEKKRDTLDKPWYHQKIVNEPVKTPKPKRTIKQQLEMERRVRQMVSDRKCRTYRKAEIVVQLMDMNFEEDEAILAANECSTLEQAISYLQQECLLCAGHYPVSQIVSMTHCQHRACRECIRAYFTVQIRDRTILDLLCPFCNEPDIGDEDVAQDYFNHLDIMLKKLVDIEIHELFQRKLRDRVLMKDPNFRWCSQCSSGFIAMPNLKRLVCPDCNAVTCASCRRLWEREHQGISCEAFAAMKDASDPEAQTVGLAKMLTEDGIACPSCHFRYALAKGGCMHFRCIQCQHDFCSGCSRPFKMGQKCGVSEFCAKLGLHAHHPRNCLFYLRDKEPEDLQKLLDMSDVKYDTEPPDGMEVTSTCQVMEQKETADGMVDDYCGKEVQDGYAGLCRLHYVEYLGQLVNKHKVDPIQIFENDDLELVLRRANIRLPPRRYRENDAQYREKLVNLIQEELPLDKMDGS